MVARVESLNMQQDRDEPIRNFGARLRGQAGVCKFTTKCPNCDRNVENTTVMADTGCQSCLGLHQTDLIPVTMRMYAANNKGITILRATILRFSGKGKSGATLETRQITYVTDSSDQLFLSREACTVLGIISESSPP